MPCLSAGTLTQSSFEVAGLGGAPRIEFANGLPALALGLSGLLIAAHLEDGSGERGEGRGAFHCFQEPRKGRGKMGSGSRQSTCWVPGTSVRMCPGQDLGRVLRQEGSSEPQFPLLLDGVKASTS